MKALITGISGFAGSHLAEFLLNEQVEVFGLIRRRSPLHHLNSIQDSINLVEGDLQDSTSLRTILREVKPDWIFHLAAQSRIQPSIIDADKTFKINYTGTLNVLKASKEHNVLKFIFSSSSACYGLKNKVPFKEDMAYDCLSENMKMFLQNLKAWHESEHIYKGRYSERGVSDKDILCPSSLHPVIRTHPETGKKAIFVNRSFTTKIDGMTSSESKAILNFLFDHCEDLRFQIRYRWNKNDMAFWDNRCTMHRAVWDYYPMERKGRRVTIKGDEPK